MATVSANFSSPPSWPNPNSELISQPSDVNSIMTSARTLDHLNDSDVHDGNDSDDAVSLTHSNLNANLLHHRNTLSAHSESLDSKTPPTLLHVSFNQDQACFAAATDNGFRIFNCDPFCEVFRREFDGGGGSGGGIGVVEMLFRCNILSLVGGGSHPLFPPNKVMVWDDNESRCTSELSFRTPVRGVRIRRDRIVVALEQMISVYNYTDLKLMDQIETFANPKGLCEVSYLANSFVLVCPGLQKGQVRVEHYTEKKTKFIKAHDSAIACLALTLDGRLVATASTKGTLIRIFNTVDGTLLQEVRRGAHAAEIHSLAISSKAEWLAVSSDKGTVHIFCLKVNPGSPVHEYSQNSSASRTAISSSSSSFSLIRGVLPRYFSSEWSVAQFRLHEGSRYIVAFGQRKDTVIILGMDGSFYRCQFDPVHGGEMTQLEYHNFLKPEEAV